MRVHSQTEKRDNTKKKGYIFHYGFFVSEETTYVVCEHTEKNVWSSLCPFRLVVRTLLFHGKNTGSIPVRGALLCNYDYDIEKGVYYKLLSVCRRKILYTSSLRLSSPFHTYIFRTTGFLFIFFVFLSILHFSLFRVSKKVE